MKKFILFIVFLFLSFNPVFAQMLFQPFQIQSNNTKNSSTESIKKLNKKIESGSASEDDYIARGKIYMEKGKYTLAINDFSEAVKLNNLSLKAYVERAEAYFEMENIFGAKQDLSEIFNGVIPDVSKGSFYNNLWKRAYILRAKIAEKEGDSASAEADYKTAENFN
ncbi:MAG: tetratricopeptide repeat protein [Alphaproteobacteria bacterium]|nr:tetratricopeptide repeat protein [Alphaproteobacteria bacterium]